MIERLLPSWVRAVDTTSDASEDLLWPAERAVLQQAVAKRRVEFTTVRVCARAALAELGVPPAPILPGARGAPSWPAGIVGSMTHCAGYRGAAVASDKLAASIGIDAEPHGPLPEGVLEAIALPQEHSWLAELAASAPQVHWDRLLFSMKESVYKAWFPLTGKWLDFSGACITVEPAAGSFTAVLQVPGPVLNGRELTTFTGRFSTSDTLVLTAITVPADAG
ncbi:MAG TPA: 4'-phosphopantetheinyl transferase superfamily protein [Jatrophihabitans sp.]|uniref:4'-phosphopantetheinyl transferase family protein n=1 Tax=Jatrophihabitans sp. TaxID=1932789 RepID=UPI002EDEF73C